MRGVQPWVITLAGGEGLRMCPFAEHCFGEARPKQYCDFCGGRSMLEQTLRRAASISTTSRLITVIGRDHRRFLPEPLPGLVLRQPCSRGTAVGVFWPLSMLPREQNREIALILPSDHFLYPDDGAAKTLREACELARSRPDRIVLVGAEPDDPEPEYGWIEPGWPFDPMTRAAEVLSFHEKPGAEEAAEWMAAGHLWNTMITAASVGTLRRLGKRVLPEVVGALERPDFSPYSWPPSIDPDSLESIYAGLPIRDFSRDFLTHVTAETLVLPMRGLVWSDWGRPERIEDSLNRLARDFPESWEIHQEFPQKSESERAKWLKSRE
jgi:mannose-1-phosphate guanylyltransferase